MAETIHARSRMAAIIGLVLQIAATVAVFLVAGLTQSHALAQVTWLLGGGVLIWLAALLIFRQHELADFEALDLEELRREKQAAGGEALFGESAGYLVARNRLDWMVRYMAPAIGLVYAAYLLTLGVYNWSLMQALGTQQLPWSPLQGKTLPLAMIVLSAVMLLLFFMARYAAGMAGQPRWQMLRGPGSFMLLGSVLLLAVVISLAIVLTRGDERWERYLAYAIPAIMIVIGLETLLLFIADIYRPRSPGVIPRACFDSRVLAILTLPGGLASGISEAINYQFGFQVSQTSLYRLAQRELVGLVWAGATALWLLTSIVIVYPHERAIVERFGRQLSPETPLEPGVHFKLPAPFDRAYKYNVGQLQSFIVGFKTGDRPEYNPVEFAMKAPVELWADPKHGGHEHFDFVIAPSGRTASGAASRPTAGASERAAVNLIRLHAFVQYRIRADQLDRYTRSFDKPEEAIRRIAWNEVLRFNASAQIDELMSERREEMGRVLRERIAAACEEQKLGLEVVYAGIIQAHPEATIAKAFAEVVNARQRVIADIRSAAVESNKLLSAVAGDRERAAALADTIVRIQAAETRRAQAERFTAGQAAAASAIEALLGLSAPYHALLKAEADFERATSEHARMQDEFELGMGQSRRSLEEAVAATQTAQAALDAARTAYASQADPLKQSANDALGPEAGAAAATEAEARMAMAYWNAQLEQLLVGLEGAAAVRLAQAQATRWNVEMQAAGEVAVIQNERFAYEAAPEVYRVRRFLEVLKDGLGRARKYLIMEEDSQRVKLRIEAQERERPDLESSDTRVK